MRIFNLFPSTPRDLTCIPVGKSVSDGFSRASLCVFAVTHTGSASASQMRWLFVGEALVLRKEQRVLVWLYCAIFGLNRMLCFW